MLRKVRALARELGEEANFLERAGQQHTEAYRCAVACAVDVARAGLQLEREFGVELAPEGSHATL